MPSVRTIVQDYGRCCEHILSSGALDTSLSEEETKFIQYYVVEMQKKFDGVRYRSEADEALQNRSACGEGHQSQEHGDRSET